MSYSDDTIWFMASGIEDTRPIRRRQEITRQVGPPLSAYQQGLQRRLFADAGWDTIEVVERRVTWDATWTEQIWYGYR